MSRIEIQGYLDKELEPSMMEGISDHLKKCETCLILFRQASADKALIDRLIDQSNNHDEDVPVPEFVPPVINRKRTKVYRIIPFLAAASITGLILLLQRDKQITYERVPEAELLINEFYDDQDLNRMWHEKSQIIILQDDKGNVIQSIITN